jgi:hypothetical protein
VNRGDTHVGLEGSILELSFHRVHAFTVAPWLDNPTFVRAYISLDGRSISWLAPVDGERTVWMASRRRRHGGASRSLLSAQQAPAPMRAPAYLRRLG